MGILLNSTGFTKEHLERIRKNTLNKWDELGFLKGLDGHVKPNIAQLYECEACSLLNEMSGDTENNVMPIVRRVINQMDEQLEVYKNNDQNNKP